MKFFKKLVDRRSVVLGFGANQSIVVINHDNVAYQIKMNSLGEFIATDLNGQKDVPGSSTFEACVEGIYHKTHAQDLDYWVVEGVRGLAQVLSRYETLSTMMEARDIITKDDAMHLIVQGQDVLHAEVVVNGYTLEKDPYREPFYKVLATRPGKEYKEEFYTSDLSSIITQEVNND